MIKLIDFHNHTSFSSDAVSDMESCVQRAIELGMKKMGFSEHIDFDYEVNKLDYIPTDMDSMVAEFNRLKAKYADKIELKLGAECGYDDKCKDKINEFIAKYPLDYTILSIHLVSGEDAWYKPFYDKRTIEQAYGEYIEDVYKSVVSGVKFDIIPHFGYVMRKAPYDNIDMDMARFGKGIDKVLNAIIERGKYLEINTNTRGVGNFLPTETIINRYFELGGRKISFGSDAHSIERIGDGMELVQECLSKFQDVEIFDC